MPSFCGIVSQGILIEDEMKRMPSFCGIVYELKRVRRLAKRSEEKKKEQAV